MKQKLLLFLALILASAQGWAAADTNGSQTGQFEQFAAQVGQTDTHVVVANFTINPNDPVIMSNGVSLQTGYPDLYSISIEGLNINNVFTAEITSATTNSCSVSVTFSPTAVGAYLATLKVRHLPSDTYVSIQLVGDATSSSDDRFPTQSSGIDFSKITNGIELSDEIAFKTTGDTGNYSDSHKRDVDALGLIERIMDWFGYKVEMYINPENLIFPVVTVGDTLTKTFEVYGSNTRLLGDISVILSDSNSVFSINPTIIYGVSIDRAFDGQKKIVKVTYKPTKAGRHKAKVTLRSKEQYYSLDNLEWEPFEIWVDFEAVAVNPPSPSINVTKSTLNFGSVHNGAEKPESFIVSGNTLTGDLSLMCNNPNFRVEPAYISADDAAKGAEVTVIYSPTESGIHNDTLTISGGGATKVPVTLVGQCDLPVIECDVSAFNFGTIVKGTTDTLYFGVNGLYLTEDINIVSSNPNFIISPPIISRLDYNRAVAVIYNPTSVGAHNGVITISSSGVSHEIRVSGQCVAPPSVTVDKTSLNFGTVTMGADNPTQRIVVTGTNLAGDLNLSISGSMFTVQPYRISPADAAGGKTVVVTYKPTAAGTHKATLLITGGGADTTRISLTGKCVEPALTASTSELTMDPVYEGDHGTATFTITGVNLSSPITLVEPWDETIGGEFSISPTVLPKTGGTVTVTYTPSGAHSSGASFKFKSGDLMVRVAVSAKGIPLPRITTNTTSLDFETIKVGEEMPLTFKVWGYDLTGDLTVSSSNSNFKVSPTTISKTNAANGVTVTVTYKPTAAGNHSGTITIKGGGASNKTVSVSGKCASLTASTTDLTMDPVYEGDHGTATFTISGVNLSAPITLVQPWDETIGGEFSITPTTLPKIGGTVTVTYTPSGTHSSGAAFKFKSGDLMVRVAVSAKGIPAPRITTSTTSLDFATVAKNSTHTKKFTVKGYNLTGNLTISPESNSYFTVSPTTITAAQAMSTSGVEVTVTYNPTARGSHSAAFTIKGGGAEPKTVSITGKCAEITTSATNLKFASNTSQTFTVKGYNLTGNLTLISSKPGVFTVSPQSITPSQAAAGVTVTVECNASTNLPSTSGKITISGGSAASKTVTLSYDANGPEPQAGLVEPEDESEEQNEDLMNSGSLELFESPTTAVNELAMESKISVEGLNIIIESPMAQSAMISDIAGHARSVNLQPGRNVIPVNTNGVYIVRVREKTAKLMIK